MQEEWRAWIGRTGSGTVALDPGQANRMAVTLDREPSYVDGDPLPAGWHWLYLHEVVRASQLGPEGHPRLGLTMPPVPLPRRMWAAGELAFGAPLRLGDTVAHTSTIEDVAGKRGRSGPLFFVTVRHELRTGTVVNLVERQTIVYREAPPATTGRGGAADSQHPTPPEAAFSQHPTPPEAAFSQHWRLDSTALFRYSALTFNGHRIHYDVDYCREVEGYPGLVVHGPLIATLLLDLAVRHGTQPAGFTYRAVSPLFAPRPFRVNGRAEGGQTLLWATDDAGRLAMRARAR